MFRTPKSSQLQAVSREPHTSGSLTDDDLLHWSDMLDPDVVAQRLFRIPTESEERLVAINDSRSLGAELLRTLATRLFHVNKRHGIKKLLITSTVPGEGKTIISANLAITLSLHHSKVLLVDGDLRRASLSRLFDIADDSFATNWREHGSRRLPLLRRAEGLSLWVVPAGEPVDMPSDVLQSAEFGEALAGIESKFDWIVFDSPPLVPFGDASILASLSDAVVLVTRKSTTPKKELEEALKQIDSSKIVATILNCADVTAHKYYLDYYAGTKHSQNQTTATKSSL